MPRFLLRLEGVNFATTLDDTNDLSTIRGASLALLRSDRLARSALATHAADVAPVFSGASQCAFTFDATDETAASAIAAAVRRSLAAPSKPAGGDPLAEAAAHLSFVIDAVPAGPDALEHATARNRTRQFREWTLPLPAFDPSSKTADPFDSTRPGTATESAVPSDKFLLREIADAKEPPRYAPSVIARRRYGRSQRQAFYKDEVGAELGGTLGFADDFEALVANPPDRLPVSLRNKMAVIYADGNRFGHIRQTMTEAAKGDAAAAFTRFSDQLGGLRRGLLADLCAWYRAGYNMSDAAHPSAPGIFAARDAKAREDRYMYRLETLLWGGDELTFVMPSWLALEAVDALLEATRGWTIEGDGKAHPLTHAWGVAIAHHKTPIRQAKRIAKALAETCKTMNADGGPHDAVSIAAFESLSPSEADLGEARAGPYGASDAAQRKALDAALVLPGHDFSRVIETLQRLKSGGDEAALPRSQLYAQLRQARKDGGLVAHRVAGDMQDRLDAYARRVRGEPSFDLTSIALPSFGKTARPLPVTLGMLAELWDYADPFPALPWPAFPRRGGRA